MLVTRRCQRILGCSSACACAWPRQLRLASPLGTHITAAIRPHTKPTFAFRGVPTAPPLPILASPSAQSALCCRASGNSHSIARSDDSDSSRPHAQQQPSLLTRLAAAARALLIAASRMYYILVAIVVLVAALPALLSTQAGSRAACWAANRALAPGTVTVDSISLGWQSPVSIHGLVVNQGAPHTSRELISIDRISTAEPLYKVVRNAGAATVVVKQPTFDITLDEIDGQLRLAKLGEEAKFPFALPAVGSHAAAASGVASTSGDAASDRAAAGEPAAAASQPEETAADTTVSGTSSKAADAAGSRQQGAAAKAAATSGSKAASSTISTASAQPTSSSTAAEKAIAAELAAGRAVAPSALKRRLACADASVEFSAELRAWGTDVVVTDGLLLLSAELKEAIGGHVHTVAAIGKTQTADLAAELNLDSSWVEAGPDADKLSIRELRSATPMLLVTDSDRVVANARGWWLGGRSALLERPVEAKAELTPELASMTLAQVNPLLQGAFQLQERGRVAATLAPQGLRLPCDSALLQVEPLKLQLGQGQMMGQLFDLLKLPQQGRQGQQQQGQQQGQQQQQVEAWTGPMELVVETSGRVQAHRLDMLMGNPARGGIANAVTGIHLALWGEVDIMGDTLRMKVGLPASTLALVGIRGLPPAYVLPLELSGSLTAPGLHWAAAARQMAVLSTLQLSRAGAGLVPASIGSGAGGGGLLGRAVGAANRMITQAIGQVDARVQAELQDVPEALPVPWATRSTALPPAS